jgi:hypothetical protein
MLLQVNAILVPASISLEIIQHTEPCKSSTYVRSYASVSKRRSWLLRLQGKLTSGFSTLSRWRSSHTKLCRTDDCLIDTRTSSFRTDKPRLRTRLAALVAWRRCVCVSVANAMNSCIRRSRWFQGAKYNQHWSSPQGYKAQPPRSELLQRSILIPRVRISNTYRRWCLCRADRAMRWIDKRYQPRLVRFVNRNLGAHPGALVMTKT